MASLLGQISQFLAKGIPNPPDTDGDLAISKYRNPPTDHLNPAKGGILPTEITEMILSYVYVLRVDRPINKDSHGPLFALKVRKKACSVGHYNMCARLYYDLNTFRIDSPYHPRGDYEGPKRMCTTNHLSICPAFAKRVSHLEISPMEISYLGSGLTFLPEGFLFERIQTGSDTSIGKSPVKKEPPPLWTCELGVLWQVQYKKLKSLKITVLISNTICLKDPQGYGGKSWLQMFEHEIPNLNTALKTDSIVVEVGRGEFKGQKNAGRSLSDKCGCGCFEIVAEMISSKFLC